MVGVECRWGRRRKIVDLWHQRPPHEIENPVELTPDRNAPITYEIGTITRPIVDLAPEKIGLTRSR